ncbi:MAG TPA: lysophospholipid acyltransferase family protein [Desulfobaccales bacterium]
MLSSKKKLLAWGLWFQFWLVVITLITGSTVIVVAPIDRDGKIIQRTTRWWGRTLLRLAHIPVEVQGWEHLTPGQAYVFAANHRSNFDIFTLISILPGRIMFVAKKSLFQIPIFGQALLRMGSVPLDRSNIKQAIKSLDRAAARVQAGASMIIFPEGTRVLTPELIPFKKGVFIMASKAGQPIVPVSLNGTRYIQPPGTVELRPGPIKVVISPPIHPRDYQRKEDLMTAVFQAIAANYDPYYPYGPERQL